MVQPGTRLGSYEIVSALGAGGMDAASSSARAQISWRSGSTLTLAHSSAGLGVYVIYNWGAELQAAFAR